MNVLKMEIYIMESIKMEWYMDRVIIYGYLVNIMMVNGSKEIRRDMEFGKA
jgi:hypothetical protein